MGSASMAVSASLGNCLPTQGGAEEGLNAAEDGESEGSGGTHLMPLANRHVDDVKLTGWLYKHRKGHFRQQWYRRFFVLRGTHLAYYKTSPWQQEVSHLLPGCCMTELCSSTAPTQLISVVCIIVNVTSTCGACLNVSATC